MNSYKVDIDTAAQHPKNGENATRSQSICQHWARVHFESVSLNRKLSPRQRGRIRSWGVTPSRVKAGFPAWIIADLTLTLG